MNSCEKSNCYFSNMFIDNITIIDLDEPQIQAERNRNVEHGSSLVSTNITFRGS